MSLQVLCHDVTVDEARSTETQHHSKQLVTSWPKPGYSLEGKSSRYDIYPKKALGKG